MSKKGIDVSAYQGNINWKAVKEDGIEFAILKIIRKDLAPDKMFEAYLSGCNTNGIKVLGVYNYSYALTEQKAVEDAQAVIRTLNGRRLKVWIDVEDKIQQGLGRKLIEIINAYGDVITSNGLEFGIYTGLSFYNTYIKPYIAYLRYTNFWIARYGLNNGGMSTKYQPNVNGMEGWQYTSKGKVNGINGNVDMDVWYSDIAGTKANIPSVSLNGYKEPTRLLYKRTPMMNGLDVKWVQYELIRHGCLDEKDTKGKSNIDGWYGKDTEAAVKKFQTVVKIAVDGKVGVVTRTYLKK